MTKNQARQLLAEHVKWLRDEWHITAKRRTYAEEIEEAIATLAPKRKPKTKQA